MKLLQTISLIIVLFLFSTSLVYAEIETFTHEVKQTFGGSQSPDDARVAAMVKVKREVLEMAGTYLETLTIVKDFTVDKEEILALAAGVLKAEIISQKNYATDDAFGIIVKAEVQVDTSILDKRIKKLLQDRPAMEKLKESKKREKELLAKVRRLEQQNEVLQESPSIKEEDRLREEFRKLTQELIANTSAVSCSDDALSIRIPSKFKGPFYNPERYDLSVQVTNNQDKTILLTHIIVYFKNQDIFDKVEAYRRLDIPEDNPANTFYISIYENPGVLLPRDSKKFNLMGPDFLPKEVELVILHSNTKRQTICNLTVSSYENIEYPMPMRINLPKGGLGFDVIPYIKKARPKNSKLLSILPGDYNKLIQGNGLFILHINEWNLNFINNLNKGSFVRVGIDGIKHGGDYDATGIPEIPNFDKLIEVQRIKLGPEEALKIANSSDSIYGNSPYGWALLTGLDNNGKALPIWRLPYIGRNYLNIFIDAESGKILPSILFSDKFSPLRTISRTTFKKNDETIN